METASVIPLRFDARAGAIVAARLARKPDAVLQLTLTTTLNRGFAYVVPELRWAKAARIAQHSDLVPTAGPHGVYLFVAPRLLRYLTWHPAAVTGQRLGPFTWLMLAVDPLFVDALRRWEQQHPTIALPSRMAA